MPLTRRQAAHNTRSTGRATHQLGVRKKRKRNVSDSLSRETLTSAQSDRLDDHHWASWARFDLRRSLGNGAYHWANKPLETAYEIYSWFLAKELPVVNIIARKFRKTYPLITLFVTSAILMHYHPFDPRQLIFWAEVSPDIYHNDVLRPPQHPWIKREEEVSFVVEEIKRLSQVHHGKEIHVYFKGGPGSGKSELARQVALSLNESHKQSQRPSALITIQADVSCLLSSLWDAIEAVVRVKRDPRIKVEDSRKEIDDEYKFEMFLKENEEDQGQKTRTKLKVLCNKLVELLENTSLPVLIFDNVHDLEVLNSLNLKPGNDHFATFVIIFTLQQNVSLDRLPRDYVHVQDLSQGMSL